MRIAIALFPDFEELDAVGPWEVLGYWARHVAAEPVEVLTVAETLEPVRAAKGLRVLPDHTPATVGRFDVLVVPGGIGTRRYLGAEHAALHEGLRRIADEGVLITSVCTGSLILAAAGLLHGRAATTHWQNLDLLASLDPSIDVRRDERFVDAGPVITAAGVSAGIDMALHLVVRLDSEAAARDVRRGIQYDPEPPV